MNTWLYLTAEGLGEPSADWPCCVWSSTAQRQSMPLNQAAQLLDGQAVDLLLPMELCSWVRSDPWPSKRQPGAQAVAFAVEDQLSEALEKLHLSIGARDQEGRYPVMVIDRQRFAAMLALLAEEGIEVRSVFVDADVLPLDQALGVWWFGRWLVGGGLPARLTLTDDGLTLLGPALPAGIQWVDERQGATDVDQYLAHRPAQAINLLQGEFALRNKRLPWRLGGLTILTLLLLTWGASAARIHFLESETRRLYSQNEQRFKTLYPEQSRIVDLATQLNTLQQQTAEPQRTRVAELVTLVEQVIGASNVEVRRIEFRAGDGWKIQLSANSFAELEQLRERGRQQGVPLRLDSASKERDRVQATLTVEDRA
ncbi:MULTISPECIES: type II secretion system protein GspL [unclassified Pseudomonas]|uniref:type II secretion system protein GspL n=1 Tax=unclassified Pseudomonas TaxID=196821 RepID=UPI0002709555|nr:MULTISPECIES: type II secretion system protein GspL [unclassified Pseudomonas]EJM84129.1 type II secretory pathway, component PulL [Pseudomonas sp. GM67]MBD9546869.1 type II secretory protein pull [Pseudomonas sp. PDM01]